MRWTATITIILIFFFIFSITAAATTPLDLRGKIYFWGTSNTEGHQLHRVKHSQCAGGSQNATVIYYLEGKMEEYHILVNTSDWYQNETWLNSYDKYNFGWGGSSTQQNQSHDGVDPYGDGKGNPLETFESWINKTWISFFWRLQQVDFHDVEFVFFEGGNRDLKIGAPWGDTWQELANDTWRAYNVSLYYGFTLVIVGMIPSTDVASYNQTDCYLYNRWCQSFGANHSDVIVLDLMTSNLTNISDWSLEYPYDAWEVNQDHYGPDNPEVVHINQSGYMIWTNQSTQLIYDFLNQTYGPVAHNPGIANNSQVHNETLWNVTIDTPDGRVFNWTIETKPNVGSSEGNNSSNGSVNITLSGVRNGSYIVYVNTTDGTFFDNYIFGFEGHNVTSVCISYSTSMFDPRDTGDTVISLVGIIITISSILGLAYVIYVRYK